LINGRDDFGMLEAIAFFAPILEEEASVMEV
jgi:hypothetical protein